ncbi:MAG: hypothetical protein HFI76_14295 [Lachnospiraceae bacterium]|nr:hypothetical protein [Lachnospiraceae bacterium]
MRTTFVTPPEYAREALRLAQITPATGTRRPLGFWKVMKRNRGALGKLTPFGTPKDGLEPKNPVIVALGDSVTAGHFEAGNDHEEIIKKAETSGLEEGDIVEITDARECYLEKFRLLLIDKYEQTSVSVLNAGIAGDTIYGMQKRLYRDVIRYQPDLVLINGSLNWGEEQGDTQDYASALTQVVLTLQSELKSDLVLMTPNMELPARRQNPRSPLKERVKVIRSLAQELGVCLADTYKVWECYQKMGYPLEALLASPGHPSVTGHEMYATVLMQLMEP